MKPIVLKILLIAMSACAGLLVWQQVAGGSLPGCGPTSACAGLAQSPFGTLLNIPVSILGLGYGLALLVAGFPAIASLNLPVKSSTAKLVLAVVWLGGLTSLFYIGVMAISSRWCLYCLAFHVLHLTFLSFVTIGNLGRRMDDETVQDTPPAQPASFWLRFLGTFAATVLLATSADRFAQQSATENARQQSQQSVDRVLAELDDAADSTDVSSQTFTGRHPRGAALTTARLVVFQDYQCGDCRELEASLQTAFKEHPDLHVSIRQFPLCDDCNPEIHYPWFHPEACRAARVAEAAQQLGDEEAFWVANEWLFDNKAQFDEDDLRSLANRLSINDTELLAAIESDSVREQVAQDIQLGISLGVSSTPFVFLNGVAIEGAAGEPTNVTTALERLADEVADLEQDGHPVAKRPPNCDPMPPVAADRIVKLWSEADAVKTLPDREACQHVLGDADSDQRVILFLEPTYSDAGGMWQMLDKLVDLRDQNSRSVRVELYLYPISRELNPRFADRDRDFFPRSTTTTQILKAIHQIADDDAFDQALRWLSSEGRDVPVSKLVERTVTAVGDGKWSQQELEQAMKSDAVANAIQQDLQQAKQCEITWAPNLIVGQRISPSDTLDAKTVSRMLDHPLRQAEASSR